MSQVSLSKRQEKNTRIKKKACPEINLSSKDVIGIQEIFEIVYCWGIKKIAYKYRSENLLTIKHSCYLSNNLTNILTVQKYNILFLHIKFTLCIEKYIERKTNKRGKQDMKKNSVI